MAEMATIHSTKHSGLEVPSWEGDAYEQDSTNLQNHEQGK